MDGYDKRWELLRGHDRVSIVRYGAPQPSNALFQVIINGLQSFCVRQCYYIIKLSCQNDE
jgi:hypothetical protein